MSRCVEFDNCRYNGEMISSPVVRQLKKRVKMVPVCPEVEIGLGVPRQPLRLIVGPSGHRLIQPATGRDVTETLKDFSTRFLDTSPFVDGIILKDRSPSCGLRNAGIFADAVAHRPLKKGMGLFASQVVTKFPFAVITDELHLKDPRKRDHFLTSIFTSAEFHAIRNHESKSNIVQFHAENKYLLTAYHRQEYRILTRLITNRERRPFDTVIREYQDRLLHALAKPPRFTSHIAVLTHALGHLEDAVTEPERKQFNKAIERFRKGLISVQEPRDLIKKWALQYDEDYLLQQTYFEPYPAELSSTVI